MGCDPRSCPVTKSTVSIDHSREILELMGRIYNVSSSAPLSIRNNTELACFNKFVILICAIERYLYTNKVANIFHVSLCHLNFRTETAKKIFRQVEPFL